MVFRPKRKQLRLLSGIDQAIADAVSGLFPRRVKAPRPPTRNSSIVEAAGKGVEEIVASRPVLKSLCVHATDVPVSAMKSTNSPAVRVSVRLNVYGDWA